MRAFYFSAIGFLLSLQSVNSFAMAKGPIRSEEEIQFDEQTCENVDLRSNLDPKITGMFATARDQRDSNLCYAFASADMLSFELKKPVSAFHLAIQYNRRLTLIDKAWRGVESLFGEAQAEFPEGGFMHAAIRQAINKFGVCSENLIQSDSGRRSFKDEMKSLNQILASTESESAKIAKINEVMSPYFTDQSFGDKDPRDLYQQALRVSKPNALSFLSHLSDAVCSQDARRISNFEVVNSSKPYDFKDDFNRLLLEGKSVGVTYQSEFSHKPDGSETFFNSIYPDHVVVAMGQRFNKANRTCEILIRDSYGPSCDHLKDTVSCERKENQATGYFWMARKDLIEHMGFYTYLNKTR